MRDDSAKAVSTNTGNPFNKPKLNQRYEIREIDNGFIVTGWIQGEYFEVYREDLKTVEFFISTKLK